MEANASDRTIVLIKLLEQRAHPIIPQLDNAAVQTKKIHRQIVEFETNSYA